MTAPHIRFEVQPKVNGIVRYLALAPSASNQRERFQLSFEAKFTNLANQPVHLTRLRISFPDAPELGVNDIGLRMWQDDGSITQGLDLSRTGSDGDSRTPVDFETDDNIVLTSTPPPTIRFEVTADDFNEPARFTFQLARHEVAYLWMGKAHDLKRGEYWQGIGAQHCCGHQLFAHDFGVECFDHLENGWNKLVIAGDKTKNSDYRIWGKPVYAMADGTVVKFANHFHDSQETPHLPANPPSAFGNFFELRHGTDLMIYAHFQQGSLNEALIEQGEGAFVRRGDYLGRVGNSGNSSWPHLHIHCLDEASRMLRPIPWQQKMLTSKASAEATGGDWILSQHQGLAVVDSLVYPGDAMPANQLEWREWESLGGELLFGPCVSSWIENRLDVFGVGTDRALYHKFWNGNRWSDWESLGGELTSKPAAVSWSLNRIDVFGRGVNNSLFHKWWDGRWHAWEELGGTLLSGPAVSSRRPDHMDVFVVATDGSLHHRIWNGSIWTPWEGLGGTLTSDPAAISWNNNRIDVFGRGVNGALFQKWWDGSWSEWTQRNRHTAFGPAVSSRRANRLDVFVVAQDGTLQHNIWNGSQWTPWESLGGFLTADPAAVSWGTNRIDVFGRGADKRLYHTFWRPRS